MAREILSLSLRDTRLRVFDGFKFAGSRGGIVIGARCRKDRLRRRRLHIGLGKIRICLRRRRGLCGSRVVLPVADDSGDTDRQENETDETPEPESAAEPAEEKADQSACHDSAADDCEIEAFSKLTLPIAFESVRCRRQGIRLRNFARKRLRNDQQVSSAGGTELSPFTLIRSTFWAEHLMVPQKRDELWGFLRIFLDLAGRSDPVKSYKF
jgi:hypothetical protein